MFIQPRQRQTLVTFCSIFYPPGCLPHLTASFDTKIVGGSCSRTCWGTRRSSRKSSTVLDPMQCFTAPFHHPSPDPGADGASRRATAVAPVAGISEKPPMAPKTGATPTAAVAPETDPPTAIPAAPAPVLAAPAPGAPAAADTGGGGSENRTFFPAGSCPALGESGEPQSCSMSATSSILVRGGEAAPAGFGGGELAFRFPSPLPPGGTAAAVPGTSSGAVKAEFTDGPLSMVTGLRRGNWETVRLRVQGFATR